MIFLVSMLYATASMASIPIVVDSPSCDRLGYGNCDFTSNGESDVIAHCITEAGIVLDVGANRGDWTDTALRAHPDITVFAFEPIPSLHTALKKRFSHNNVVIVPIAISSSTGTASFDYYPLHDGLSGLINRPTLGIGSPQRLIVETITLDQFCEEQGIEKIAFLKIDTEGAEYAVLSGAYSLLKSQKIRALQFEYGGTYPDAGHTLKEVYELLVRHGYSVYRICKGKLIYVAQWRDVLETYQYSNYLAVSSGENPCVS